MRLLSFPLCVYIAVICTHKSFVTGNDVTITSMYGDVKGNVENTLSVPVARFLGIPYAQPPSGTSNLFKYSKLVINH